MGAAAVAAGTDITATFSEAVQAVSETTFTLADPAGNTVAGAVSYDAVTRIATLNPSAHPASGSTYTATLTGGTTAIRDLAGNALGAASWSFTTMDTVVPTVSTRSPGSAATAVAAGTNVTATFNEAVSGTTFTLRTGTATGTGTAVAGAVTYDAASRVATFDPSANDVHAAQRGRNGCSRDGHLQRPDAGRHVESDGEPRRGHPLHRNPDRRRLCHPGRGVQYAGHDQLDLHDRSGPDSTRAWR